VGRAPCAADTRHCGGSDMECAAMNETPVNSFTV
jgi:hypothetical protein